MNKNELISAVAEKSGLSKKDSEKALNAALVTITATVAAGNKVQLIGFGTFELRERAEKQARNPRTGEKMTVPACKAPAFKAGQAFKDAAK
ncbi:MAG: HU family DNA-binding protein [Clostridia bacterium]|nr:HU family DNA-binding protein [Clostridia bacterium]